MKTIKEKIPDQRGQGMQRQGRQLCIWHLVLTILCLALNLGPALLSGSFFGYGSDWISQHLPLAESLRGAMLQSGRLIPLYMELGGGTSIYDFAYYGLLRPDILLGCLLPNVGMEYILAGYSLAGLVLGTNLMFRWLYRQGKNEKAAAAATIIFLSATCFYHAHNQLMFVNYMPFLIMTLVGIDKMAQSGKGGLVTAGLTLIYFHSFYYAISCLAICMLYVAHVSLRKSSAGTFQSSNRHFFLKFLFYAGLSIGIGAVLLLPSGLDILSGGKDGGAFAKQDISIVDLSLQGMLYSGYGMGVTLLALYCVLNGLTQKKTRFLAVSVLVAAVLPAVSLVLNGFLYARGKILIPFLVLTALLCEEIFRESFEGRHKPKLWIGAACMIPWAATLAKGADGSGWMFWDSVLIVGWNVAENLIAKRFGKTGGCRYRMAGLLLIPCLFMTAFQQTCGYVAKENINFSQVREVAAAAESVINEQDPETLFGVRWEILSEGYKMSNFTALPLMKRTSMYSSMMQQEYGEFFYDVSGNAIPARNRVALVPGKNILFNTSMGIRYVTAEEGQLPDGYRPISRSNGYVTGENPDALPICYGTDKLLSSQDYASCVTEASQGAIRKLTEALSLSRTDVQLDQDWIIASEGEEQVLGSQERGAVKTDEMDGQKQTLQEQQNQNEKAMILSFDLTQTGNKEVTIEINGVKNKLSGSNAPYPNHNTHFTYVLSGKDLASLHIRKNTNEYVLKNVKCHIVDQKQLAELRHVYRPKTMACDSGSGGVFSGIVPMKTDGFFETTRPFRQGYHILVDGQEQQGQRNADGFLCFPLKSGQHRIEISFTPPGYIAGLVISLISTVAFLLAILLRAVTDKKSS